MTRFNRFFTKVRDGKTFLIPFRRETSQPPTPAVQTFTRSANGGRARAANRAKNKQARRSRKANRTR